MGYVEEGELSDVEEISEEEFIRQEEAKMLEESNNNNKNNNNNNNNTSSSSSSSRVWNNYPFSSNYGSGLYNFAWAQAVQNKPLIVEITPEEEEEEVVVVTTTNNVILEEKEEEKEEGEIEEGEIDELDSEVVELKSEEGEKCLPIKEEEEEENLSPITDEAEFEKRICLILEALDTVTVSDAEKCFGEVCSRLRTALDTLQLIVSESGLSVVGGITDQCFVGFEDVNSVFNSMNPKEKGQNKQVFTSLLAHMKNQVPSLFSAEQMEEVQAVLHSLDPPPSISLGVKDMEVEREVPVNNDVKSELGILGEKPVKSVNELGILGQKPGKDLGILGEKPGQMFNSLKVVPLEPSSTKLGDQNNAYMGSQYLKQGLTSGIRGRGSFGPLLDLHRDHDVDSLPSPTREAPPPLHFRKQQVDGDRSIKAESKPKVANKKSEDASVHFYETDALKAVSTYQQKFGRNSFLLSNRLPSPTPSGEGDDGDGDSNGEVSSSSSVGNARAVNPLMPPQAVVSVTEHMDKSGGQGVMPVKTMGQIASRPNSHGRASSKSRDPRLRLANPEGGTLDPNARPLLKDTPKNEHVAGVLNSRKNKNDGDIIGDGRTVKKQRNGVGNWEVSRENCSSVGTPVIDRIQSTENRGDPRKGDPRKSVIGGIFSGQRQGSTTGIFNPVTGGPQQLPVTGSTPQSLPSIGTFNPITGGLQNLPVIGSTPHSLPSIGTFNPITGGPQQLPVIGSTTQPLPSLLKDIAVDPALLMQLIMEQQRLQAEAQKSSNLPQSRMPAFSSSFTPGAAPLVTTAQSKSSGVEQKPLEKQQTLPSMNLQGELGVRMKPRDPRRILHSSTFQTNESFGSTQFKTNGSLTSNSQASKDNMSGRQQSQQGDATSLPTHSSPPPDITRQFTKNLRNLADIISSQPTDTVPTDPQSAPSSLSMPVKAEQADLPMTASTDQHIGPFLRPAEGETETSRSETTWGDVEHLFEGYDEQQKAAIQRERARRIEEQNTLFAAKKLCLVLDLDHTLLNSAKFVEVDPVHEEILRKKEEQDREKPHRHLFRFSHMGMWTKLRPGIWTFLEKASKLYELHLYTMGNKLYATEMAKVLDPSGVLFSGRVISKGDDGDPFDGDEKIPKSKDLEGVLGMESSVVIVDDSVKVWPHNKLNLILVERYTYFPCSRRQFGLPGPSLLEIDHDERPEDGTLASSLTVIERIHQNFFSNLSLKEVDVRNILASEQRKILAGCRIVFSRIFPVGETKPHQHPLWQTAEQFGAVCTTQIDNLVTHVVANSLGTDKVNWALSTGRFVVHPGWVEASALLYRRASENDFAVKINLP
ncbi:hypothetical protein IFM89_007627 [Coptis chinensis]|uniref:protein-serine/threonine phosphatase n=1 Tax=Coptis chinensis TaxID=261450 RepID=A0A835HTH6_9MAGN|nr:hypothetical protein IFM89_007627 [Coptis chinensis]